MPLFSTLAKPGVCIINEKCNLCILCDCAHKVICCSNVMQQFVASCVLAVIDQEKGEKVIQRGNL